MIKVIKNRYIKLVKNENNKQLNQLPQFNFGFALLKNILSFSVIITHCFNNNTTRDNIILFITKRRRIHVPSFFILSFYFNYNTLVSSDCKKKIERIIRLLIPFIGWPIIVFVFCNYNSTYKQNPKLTSFDVLKEQIFTGQGQELFHFWYLFCLIATTLLFLIIIIIFRKRHLFVLNLLLILSYYLQYSYNYKKLLPYYHNIEGLRRAHDLFPFAVMGFNLKAFNILKILEKYKFNTFVICVLIYNFTEDYEIFRNISGIAYFGIKLNVLSICTVIIFSLFPSNKIKNKYLITILKLITNCSGGIFYLHQAVQFFFRPYYKDIRDGTFKGMILIYFISYIISLVGSTIFTKTKLKFLFS